MILEAMQRQPLRARIRPTLIRSSFYPVLPSLRVRPSVRPFAVSLAEVGAVHPWPFKVAFLNAISPTALPTCLALFSAKWQHARRDWRGMPAIWRKKGRCDIPKCAITPSPLLMTMGQVGMAWGQNEHTGAAHPHFFTAQFEMETTVISFLCDCKTRHHPSC